MKSKFDEFNEDWPFDDELNPIDQDLEKFVLLSAYIDGEVTPSERRQVQQWLDTDPQFKQQYLQQLRLHQGMNRVPIPKESPSHQLIAKSVFQEIDQQNQQKRRWVGGGILLAAILGAITSNVLVKPSLTPQYSNLEGQPQQSSMGDSSEGLVIALNQPIVELPTDIHSDMK